jgi:hypothetical protein
MPSPDLPATEQYWRLSDGVGNWVFAAVCLLIAVVLLRLILRERIMLQGSMSYLAFLFLVGGMALFPDLTGRVAHALGFSTLANFFFCAAIAALAILHLRTLIMLSRMQLRSIALTQELAILNEKLERVTASVGLAAPTPVARGGEPATAGASAKGRTEPPSPSEESKAVPRAVAPSVAP